MAWLDKAIAENRVPTTDEMDEFDPNAPHAYDVMLQCKNCSLWSMFDKRVEYKHPNVRKCEHCGSINMDGSSIISYRSFDPIKAKRRKFK